MSLQRRPSRPSSRPGRGVGRGRAGSRLPALSRWLRRRAYTADWCLFEHWCLRQGLDPLVPDPRTVGLFLAAAAGHGVTQDKQLSKEPGRFKV